MKWLDSLKNFSCMDCGNKFPPYVMDWDHRPEEVKVFTMGTIRNRVHSKERILEEISKCDLVCSNCHRIRTYLRRISVEGDTSLL